MLLLVFQGGSKKIYVYLFLLNMKIADLKPIFLPTKIRQVDNHLYRGSAIFTPVKALRVKQKGVTQVIDLRHEDGFFVKVFRKLEKLYCKLLKMEYVKKSFYKNNIEQLPNKDYYKELINQINSSSKTYIHCHFGKHRTGFAVAMYQKNKGESNETILKELLNCDWDMQGQKKNLKNFLKNFLSE